MSYYYNNKYFGKYFGVFSSNYIGIYVDEDVLKQDLKYYDNPQIGHFNTKFAAAYYIQNGLYYDLSLYHVFETDIKRIIKLSINHKHFPSVALESSFDRRVEKERFVNERREKKKKGLNC